jgi:regulator of RNase E activity RraA
MNAPDSWTHNTFAFFWIASLTISGLALAEDYSSSKSELIAGFRRVTVASVSDAVEQVTGRRGYLSHDMRPLSRERAKIVGPAVTTLLQPSLEADAPTAMQQALLAIDEAEAGSVLVVVVEENLDITGIGGLMATTCHARGLAGAVVDGAARDVDEINDLGFPVFSRSISPATCMGRYTAVGRNMRVKCAGVTVNPDDFIVAGMDGVVVVPLAKATEVLKIAREMDEKEAKMVPLIQDLKSILKAVEHFGRL